MKSATTLVLPLRTSWLRFWTVFAGAWLLMLALAPASGLGSHVTAALVQHGVGQAFFATLSWAAPVSVLLGVLWLLSRGKTLGSAARLRILAAVVAAAVVPPAVGLAVGSIHGFSAAVLSISGFALLPLTFVTAGARRTGINSVIFLWGAVSALVQVLGLVCPPTQAAAAALSAWLFAVVFGLRGADLVPGNQITTSVWAAAALGALTAAMLNAPLYSQAVGTSLWLALALASLFFFVTFLLLLPFVKLMPRWGWRVVLAVYILIGAGCNAFVLLYGTIMDPSMLRNALATDVREVRDLVSFTLLQSGFALWLPALAVALAAPRVRPQPFTGKRFLGQTAGLVVCLVAVAAFVVSQMSAGASFFRNSPRARFDLMPVAVFVNFAKTFISDSSPQATKKSPIDPNPQMIAAAPGAKPLLVVFVVGETGRAVNWSLGGYERNTNPQLSKLGVTYFDDVTSCGTSTDVSVPCMFSRPGRRNYDRKKIISQETVLSIIHRAGVDVRWVENQSGDKGVAGPDLQEKVVVNPKDCPQGTDCMDMAMVANVDAAVQKAEKGDPRQLVLLHQMGSHGPAYWKRSDETPFGAGCRNEDLGSCTRQAVIDSYDNSIVYTDKFLASSIRALQQAKDVDTVLLYVADHGESLGEKGLWLHGAPWLFAPKEQIHVPMILWMNDSAKKRFGVSDAKLQALTKAPLTHDNLFDTLLTLMGVKSSVYDPSMDLMARIHG